MNCPVCKAPEVNPETGLLNIRAYKVHDYHGFWSHCLRDHGVRTLDGVETEVKDLWFCESRVTGGLIVEIAGKRYVWEK